VGAGGLKPIFEMLQDLQFVAQQRGLKAIREADKEMLLVLTGSAGDDAHGTARMHERMVAAMHGHARDNLRTCVDIVGLMRHRSKGER
jgi:hypothetical protein